ncbi:hypothetical protein HYPSUDRAFT_212959 [Hypholoma sublateritium FD-334 SS-4]|uniref:Uncharacterized protein n=1 Tax=Hypholoma sublateritium (strain FD-334 SS-4) TaxID=945553 RepID=A0A0D2PE19_HYPSF|nr:hypothetical protein HYPSUDRAFT_212959 [Hypholoma sublateritium FD-334 SS-4]
MNSTIDANDETRPQDKQPPSDITPAAGGISPWNATEPMEIQLRPSVRLVGEPQTNGTPTPLRVCGYIFRRSDILNWVESQQLIPELKDPSVDRAEMGWSYIIHSLGPRGITCWFVRTYLLDEHGKQTQWKCTAKSLILGTNETNKERLKARNMKKVELIHKILGLPMRALGPPEWLIPAEHR